MTTQNMPTTERVSRHLSGIIENAALIQLRPDTLLADSEHLDNIIEGAQFALAALGAIPDPEAQAALDRNAPPTASDRDMGTAYRIEMQRCDLAGAPWHTINADDDLDAAIQLFEAPIFRAFMAGIPLRLVHSESGHTIYDHIPRQPAATDTKEVQP